MPAGQDSARLARRVRCACAAPGPHGHLLGVRLSRRAEPLRGASTRRSPRHLPVGVDLRDPGQPGRDLRHRGHPRPRSRRSPTRSRRRRGLAEPAWRPTTRRLPVHETGGGRSSASISARPRPRPSGGISGEPGAPRSGRRAAGHPRRPPRHQSRAGPGSRGAVAALQRALPQRLPGARVQGPARLLGTLIRPVFSREQR